MRKGHRQNAVRASAAEQIPASPARALDNKLGLFKKTRICKFYQVGACTRGTACTFAHDTKELQPQPDFFCTKLCRNLVNTGACEDPECRFAHKKDQIRKSVNFKNGEGTRSGKPKTVQEVRDLQTQESLSNSPVSGSPDASEPGAEGWPLVVGLQAMPRMSNMSMMLPAGGNASAFDHLPVAQASWHPMTLEQVCQPGGDGTDCWNLQPYGMTATDLDKTQDLRFGEDGMSWARLATYKACDFDINETTWNLSRQSTADSDGWEDCCFYTERASKSEEAASDDQSACLETDFENSFDNQMALQAKFKPGMVKDSFLKLQVQDFAESSVFHKSSGLSFRVKNTFIEICGVSELVSCDLMEGRCLVRSASCPQLGQG